MTIQRLAVKFINIAGQEGTRIGPNQDGKFVLYTDHLAALAAAAEREELWLAYSELLLEEVNAHVGLAVAHGWTGSPERYARGERLRAALGLVKGGFQ